MSELSQTRNPPSWNLIARHWRGELGLGLSFWICAVLIALPLGSAVLFGIEKPASDYDPALSFALQLVAALVVAALLLWSIVGVWRSAASHVARTGRAFWARAAQVAVVVQVALFYYQAEAVSCATSGRQDPDGPFAIRVFNGGKDIEFSGAIAKGAANALSRALREHPNAVTVHLRSRGGLLGEGFAMGGEVKVRALTTFVSHECSSACTEVFAAGAKRLLGPKGRLGFHSPRWRVDPSADPTQAKQWVEDYLARLGIDRDFARRSLEPPHDSMWYPSREELMRARMVTGTASAGDLPFWPVRPWYSSASNVRACVFLADTVARLRS